MFSLPVQIESMLTEFDAISSFYSVLGATTINPEKIETIERIARAHNGTLQVHHAPHYYIIMNGQNGTEELHFCQMSSGRIHSTAYADSLSRDMYSLNYCLTH